jgi:hypothetical protein
MVDGGQQRVAQIFAGQRGASGDRQRLFAGPAAAEAFQ